MESYYWLIAIAVLLIIEIVTLGLTTIWFAGGAFVAYIASLLQANVFIQFFLFFAVSIVLLIFTRPIAVKYLNSNRKKTNYQSYIGMEGRVIEDIDNFEGKGRILFNGIEWTARSVDDEKIPIHSKVTIEEIQGVKAIVRKI